MSILKKKKSSKKAIIATAVGGAVVAGAAALISTKKGKAILKDASDGVDSLIGSAKKLQKTIRKETKGPVRKANRLAKKTKRVTARAKK
jgi:hypothetical protein